MGNEGLGIGYTPQIKLVQKTDIYYRRNINATQRPYFLYLTILSVFLSAF